MRARGRGAVSEPVGVLCGARFRGASEPRSGGISSIAC
jgi:hypothetical protein